MDKGYWAWTSPVKEASSGESRHVECGINDWKWKGVGGSDGEEEGGSVGVCRRRDGRRKSWEEDAS